MDVSVGTRLRVLRKDAGLTQAQLAQRIDVSSKTVSKWENGSADPSTTNLLALAKLYGVAAEELLRGIDRSEE